MSRTYRKKKHRSEWGGWWILLVVGLIVAFVGGVGAAALLTREGQSTEPPAVSTSPNVSTSPTVSSRVEITLLGDSSVTVEYGEVFKDPGAEGWGISGDVFDRRPLSVDVSGNVDVSKLGKYTLTYTSRFNGESESVIRTVTVVDTVAPQITLISNPDYYTLPGQEYQEEGFTASDNYDGDLTAAVSSRVEGDTVIYTVEDSSGNQTQVQRKIRYHDPVAPKLSLKGKDAVTIQAGSKWEEPGFKASDNIDGDLTSKVVITGKVNCYRAGTYVLTYEVTDSYGNKSFAKRTVTVNAIRQPDAVVPDGKVIYLTFDDGPTNNTEKLLDILKKYNVKATFFVVKNSRMDLLDDMVADGHSIGIHSLTHRYDKIYASEDAFFDDLYAMQDLIYQHSGVRTKLMRFPGGSSNRISAQYNKGIMTRLVQSVQDQGFRFFDWNVDSSDAGNAKTTAAVTENVIKGIKNNPKDFSVVLQHDIKGYSVEAVEEIIVWGLSNGYTFMGLEMDSPICQHTVKN